MRFACLLLFLALAPGSAFADWRNVGNENAGITFEAEGFVFERAQEHQSGWAEEWVTTYDWAELYYGRAVTGGTLKIPRTIKDSIPLWNRLKPYVDHFIWAIEGQASGPAGTMHYQQFSYGARHCVAFAHGFGVQRSARPFNRPKLLAGYICDPSGSQPSAELIEGWFSDIRIAD